MLAGKWNLSILKYNYWLFRDKIQVQILSYEKKMKYICFQNWNFSDQVADFYIFHIFILKHISVRILHFSLKKDCTLLEYNFLFKVEFGGNYCLNFYMFCRGQIWCALLKCFLEWKGKNYNIQSQISSVYTLFCH